MTIEQKSRAQLILDLQKAERERDEIQKKIKDSNDAALLELVSAFVKSLKDNLFSLEDAAHLLYPEASKAAKLPKTEKKSNSTEKSKLIKGTIYRHPDGKKEWTAGGKGARPTWVHDLLNANKDIPPVV